MARVSVDAGNRLRIRRTRVLDGRWTLSRDRELIYTARKTDDGEERRISFRGSLLEAKAHALVFAVEEADGAERPGRGRISLSGRWRADDRNRLTFLVERARGEDDRLTLAGGWELGDHHELVYRVRQGRRPERQLRFTGAWDIPGPGRLSYRLAGSTRSVFEFRAALQSPSVASGRGRLAYQVGIQIERGVLRRQRVALFGAWKLHRDRSVSFEIPYAEGRVQAIRFEGAVSPLPGRRLAVELSSTRREPLGLTVTWSRAVSRNADLFLRLQRDAGEAAVVGGVEVRF